ncbi:MAG: TolC family protein [Bacteroidales bacterium]|nr:TolC family protein [Bacteroidales bacterium]
MNRNTHMNTSRFTKISIVVSLVLLVISGSIIAQKTWTLEDCINHALENNIRIKQSYLDVETGAINQRESKLDFLPNLNGSVSHSYGWGRSVDMATYNYVNQTQQSYFNISSELTLFSGFQKLNTLKQRRFDYLASKYNSDKIKNDISLSVAGAYLQILFSREQVNNAEQQFAVTNQQIDRTAKLVAAGTLAKGSLLEIQAQGANEEVSLVQAKNQLNLAYLDLLQLLEIEAGTAFQIDIPTLGLTQQPEILPIQYIYNAALGAMPEIKSAEMSYESFGRALSVAKGSRSPSLALSLGLETRYSEGNPQNIKPFSDQFKDNQNSTLAFRLSIPIFNNWQINSYVGRSKVNFLNADYNLQLAKNTLRKNVETAYADALAAYSSYSAREKSLSSLEESFSYTEQKFNVGMVNALDYNVAKNQLNKANSDLLSAKYDFIFKYKILDFYLGKTLTLKDLQMIQNK